MSTSWIGRPSRRALLAGAGSAAVAPALARAEVLAPASASSVARNDFDAAYQRNVIEPFQRTRVYTGPRLSLPMIDPGAFSKELAVPPHIWGLIYNGWEPATDQEGTSVFIQALENRGPDNARKRHYMSALTPDLYPAHYRPKVVKFLADLFTEEAAGEPLMQHYYDNYFDLYWDLHLGVRDDDVPEEIRTYGEAFTAVIGFWNPTTEAVRENYRRGREVLPELRPWIDARVEEILDGTRDNPEATFVHYWARNGELGDHFRRQDITTECVHNFLAFSLWGNTLYGVMEMLSTERGNPAARQAFAEMMAGDPDSSDEAGFTPLDRYVMELFRAITPTAGSLSTLVAAADSGGAPEAAFISHPHRETSEDPRHWPEPTTFDPERYRGLRTATDIGDEQCREVGLRRCPFHSARVEIADGRPVAMAVNGFGTVFAEHEGRPFPLVEHAGYAPLGFGYRRCAGEWLNMEVFKDLLRKIHTDRIEFRVLDITDPDELPVGPITVVTDDIGFTRG